MASLAGPTGEYSRGLYWLLVSCSMAAVNTASCMITLFSWCSYFSAGRLAIITALLLVVVHDSLHHLSCE